MITKDGDEIVTHWEWGVKFSHTGFFIPLGYVAVPVADTHFQNDSDFIQGLLELTSEMVHLAVGTEIIPTVRPISTDFA